MANDEHLEILKQGVDIWNRWRAEHPEIRPDLGGADLARVFIDTQEVIEFDVDTEQYHPVDEPISDVVKVELSGINLRDAILNRTNFTGTILQSADFSHADLSDADLSETNLAESNFTSAILCKADLSKSALHGAEFVGTDLREAYLFEADLSNAILLGANLTGANLRESDLSSAILNRSRLLNTNLTGANLSHANLSKAFMGFTVLEYVDLRTIQELDSVVHVRPSVIGVNTIHISSGEVSENFLIAAGVPSPLLSYVRSKERDLFHYSSCFISYSTCDVDFARRLHADLQKEGVRCWFAPEDMKIGDSIRNRINEAINHHDKLLLVLSEHAINSDWVENEVEAAFDKERRNRQLVLFPIRLDDIVLNTDRSWASEIRRTRHIGDFCQWNNSDAYKRAFELLLRALKAAT